MSNGLIRGVNDIATVRPDLLDEWDYEANGDLKPSDVSRGSMTRIHWICENGHQWVATAYSRACRGTGCPVCITKGRLVRGVNDMATACPDLLDEWDYEANGDLKPSDVSKGSAKRIHWICKEGHKWTTTAYSRACNGTGCPVCARGNLVRGVNDIATVRPDLLDEWDYEANGDLKPSDVYAGSGMKLNWICKKGHKWITTASSRAHRGSNCPFCNAKSTSFGEQFIYWSFKQYFPDVKTENGVEVYVYNRGRYFGNVEYDIYIKPLNLYIEYSGTFWHKEKAESDKRKKQLCIENNAKFIEVIDDWDIDAGKIDFAPDRIVYNPRINRTNPTLQLKEIIGYMFKELGLDISKLDFDEIARLTFEYSNGKPHPGESFEDKFPDIAKQWHPTLNGNILPSDIYQASNKLAWWICDKGHEYQSPIHRRSDGHGCPYCSGKKVLQGFNDLATMKPDLMKDWDYEANEIKPTEITGGSGKNIHWKCHICGYKWSSTLSCHKTPGCVHCKGRYKRKPYTHIVW